MTFDITQFELDDTATLVIQDASMENDLLVDGNQVIFTLYGPGSSEQIKAQHKANNAANLRAYAALKGKAAKDSSELTERDENAKLAACTKEITNFPVEGGALAIYSNNKLCYIKKQVEDFIRSYANFKKPSITN